MLQPAHRRREPFLAESLAAGLLGRTETHPAPNPLKEPAMTRLFHLNDTLIDPFGPGRPDLLAGRDPRPHAHRTVDD